MAVIAGFLVLAVMIFLFISPVSIYAIGSPPAPLTIGTPIHTVKFDDGSSLQILNIGDGKIVDGEMDSKASRMIYSSHTTGFGSRGAGCWGLSGTISYATIDDQITGLEFESLPANLLIKTQLLDPGNRAIHSQRVLCQGGVRMKDQSNLDFPGWNALLEAPAEDPNMPELVVQLADGVGGWIDGSGPFCLEDDREHRGMIAFPAWPRTTKEFEFRAARPGMDPVTWKIKNPSPASIPEPWIPLPLPQKHTDADFELELRAVTKSADMRMIQPQFVFRSNVPGDAARSGGNANEFTMLNCTCAELLGAWGTRSVEGHLKRPGNPVARGFPYPPDEEVLRFRYLINPTAAYPYLRSNALMIARAKVAEDGKSLESRPTILTGHGILAVEFQEVTTGEQGSFRYTISGRWNSQDEVEASKAALGERIPVCFIGESETSIGAAHTSGRSSSGSGNVTRFERQGRWEGPLHPGDEITLAMVDPLPTREVFFTFEP